MFASRATAIVEDPRYREHRGPAGHPERPERLAAVRTAIAARQPAFEALAPRPASPEEILRVHTRDHLEHVAETARRAPLHLDPDTYVSSQSFEVALLAAGGSVELARRVARGELRSGFAAVRPPGHHAEAGHAMGFCLFNNVAIAARALQAEEGLERILILDWDVHHGNGTQHHFEQDPSVLYASTHQYPFYPGTGDAGEAGRGRGDGSTLNIPLPAGCGDEEYTGVLQRILVPVAQVFRPELILLSCGFDAHRDDPLAGMRVTAEGYRAMARIVRALAEELCGGRLACVLEGGYAASGLEQGTGAVLDTLLDPGPLQPPAPAPLEAQSILANVIQRVAAVHGSRFPGLGAA
jgi:acetoin utilization deacetylase AcuC-like enzyme